MHGVVLVPSSRLDMLWLDTNRGMNHHAWTAIDLAPGSLPTNLGGTFTSPPVAVALGQDRLDVFGLGLDYALYHKVHAAAAPVGQQWSPNWANLGGNFTSTPVVVSTGDDRIDLFGLGSDQGMLHRAWHGSGTTGTSPLPGSGQWSDWDELGGGFTSLPAVLPAGSGAFDVFARGLDFMVYHAIYTPGMPTDWRLLGGGLLGEPSAASAPIAVRVHDGALVFVTGVDGAVWYTLFDGRVWKPWLSLGPANRGAAATDAVTFVSEPVAVALVPASDIIVDPGPIATSDALGVRASQAASLISERTRVDVFAVGSDNQLWQRILDHDGWHGHKAPDGHDTENWIPFGDGASFACAPSIVAPTRGATVLVMPPPRFSLVEPRTDGKIHRWRFDPTSTPFSPDGEWIELAPIDAPSRPPEFRLPSHYVFGLDKMHVDSIRSESSDTDQITVTLKVGNWPTSVKSYKVDPVHQKGVVVGNSVSSGDYSFGTNLTWAPVGLEMCEPVVLVYSILNSGDADKLRVALETVMVKGTEDFVNDVSKHELEKLGSLGIATAGGVLVGSFLGALAAFMIDELATWLLGGCDGLVAAQTITYRRGRDLRDQIALHGAQGMVTGSTQFLASPDDSSGPLCNNSSYTVFSTTSEVDYPA
jgi:hypothetical protein